MYFVNASFSPYPYRRRWASNDSASMAPVAWLENKYHINIGESNANPTLLKPQSCFKIEAFGTAGSTRAGTFITGYQEWDGVVERLYKSL